MDERDVLQSLYVDLEERLQVEDIKGCLYQNRVISFNEIEKLRIGPQFGTTRDLARELVRMLSVKGGHCALDLLHALEQCAASDSPQRAHDELILKLKEALLSRREGIVDGGVGEGKREQPCLRGKEPEPNSSCDEIDRPKPMRVSTVEGRGEGREVRRGGLGEGVSEQSSQRGCEPEPSACEEGDARRAIALSPSSHAGSSNEPVELLQYPKLVGSEKDKERLQVKLAHESQEMLECFTRFVVNVSKLLTSKSVDMETIQLSLQCRLGSCKVSDDVIKKIDAANSIPTLLRMAMPFSSWYNYNLIAFLAEEHGEEKGKKLTADYGKKLNIYLQRLVYQCPPFSALPSGKFSSDFDELSVKVDWLYEKCTLQDISLFKGKLCKALGHTDPCCFILKSVEEGCVRVTYIIPAKLVPELASKVEQATAELTKEKVISIQLGETVTPNQPQVKTGDQTDAVILLSEVAGILTTLNTETCVLPADKIGREVSDEKCAPQECADRRSIFSINKSVSDKSPRTQSSHDRLHVPTGQRSASTSVASYSIGGNSFDSEMIHQVSTTSDYFSSSERNSLDLLDSERSSVPRSLRRQSGCSESSLTRQNAFAVDSKVPRKVLSRADSCVDDEDDGDQ